MFFPNDRFFPHRIGWRFAPPAPENDPGCFSDSSTGWYQNADWSGNWFHYHEISLQDDACWDQQSRWEVVSPHYFNLIFRYHECWGLPADWDWNNTYPHYIGIFIRHRYGWVHFVGKDTWTGCRVNIWVHVGDICWDDQGGSNQPCYCAGALVQCEHGLIPIEEIKEGDLVYTQDAQGNQALRPVVRAMKRRAHVRTHQPEDCAGWPVIVQKGAFAPHSPSQDLRVTNDHSFVFGDYLVPIRMLVNNTSIRYDHSQKNYDYYHIEFEQHAIIKVNNTLSESWLNTDTYLKDNPHIHDMDMVSLWSEYAVLPLNVHKEFVEPLYHHYAQRGRNQALPPISPTPGPITSHDPAISFMTEGGLIIPPLRRINTTLIFRVPRCERHVYLCSRIFQPSHTIGPFIDDRRQLGILVGQITLWNGVYMEECRQHLTVEELPGWDVLEEGPHRWTQGRALLPLPHKHHASYIKGACYLLSVDVQAGGPYHVAESKLPMPKRRVAL